MCACVLFSLYFAAISRKRYVKEKLFNQMYNELCAAHCGKQDVTSQTSTEYSANFCSKYSNNVDQQQVITSPITVNAVLAVDSFSLFATGLALPHTVSRRFKFFVVVVVFVAILLIDQKNPMDAFKLYGENSNGISFWNSVAVKGRSHFKQYHPLTKLNSECLDEQWR